jgi:peptidyl-prolyl cis-trans isomerase C
MQVKTVAMNRSFEESKESIRQRMARERRSRDYDEWMKKLRESTKVSINDSELEKLQVEPATAPSGLPGAQPMAGHPVPVPVQKPPPTATSKIGGN